LKSIKYSLQSPYASFLLRSNGAILRQKKSGNDNFGQVTSLYSLPLPKRVKVAIYIIKELNIDVKISGYSYY